MANDLLIVIGASGGVINNPNNKIVIGNATYSTPPFSQNDIQELKKQDPVAETLQVTTLNITTVTAGDIIVVGISGNSLLNGNGNVFTFTYTAVTGDDETDVWNAMRTMIDQTPDIPVTTSGTDSLVLTAVSGLPVFGYSVSSTITATATTAGVVGIGQGDLINLFSTWTTIPYANYTGNEIVDATNYTVYQVIINMRTVAGAGIAPNHLPLYLVLLVDSTNTGDEALIDEALGVTSDS